VSFPGKDQIKETRLFETFVHERSGARTWRYVSVVPGGGFAHEARLSTDALGRPHVAVVHGETAGHLHAVTRLGGELPDVTAARGGTPARGRVDATL